MGFLDSILSPLYTAVSWIIVQFHSLYSQVFTPNGGLAWGLAIVSLVIFVRACMIPLTIKQTKSMRAMQAVQPRLKALQDRYKGDRQKLSEETMKLYKEAGANPASSCLPLLVQSPFFMSLYGVLRNVAHQKPVGVIRGDLLISADNAHIFGAQLSATFLNSPLMATKVVTAIMIVTMCFTQFLTTRQLMTKNVDLSVKTPYMQQQKMMMYVFPVMYIFIGINMPVGVLVYMVTSNMWTLGQQLVIIRQNPTPGSVAFKQRQERLKAAGKLNADGTPVKAGLASLVKGGSAAPVVEETPEETAPARRQQPKRQSKSQRQSAAGAASGAAAAAGSAPVDAAVEETESESETVPRVSTAKTPAGRTAGPAKSAGSAKTTPAQSRGRAKTGSASSAQAQGGGQSAAQGRSQATAGQGGGGQNGGGQNGGQKRSNQPAKRNPQPAGRPKKKS